MPVCQVTPTEAHELLSQASGGVWTIELPQTTGICWHWQSGLQKDPCAQSAPLSQFSPDSTWPLPQLAGGAWHWHKPLQNLPAAQEPAGPSQASPASRLPFPQDAEGGWHRQNALQKRPVEHKLPSQASPASSEPFPQDAGIGLQMQLPQQASPAGQVATTPGGSQVSPPSRTPLPQLGFSVLHIAEQPSPSI